MPGDRALADLLGVHNAMMSGGTSEVRDLSVETLDAGRAGFRFFVMEQATELLTRLDAAGATSGDAAIQAEYYADIDAIIIPAFESYYRDHRDEFADA